MRLLVYVLSVASREPDPMGLPHSEVAAATAAQISVLGNGARPAPEVQMTHFN